MTNIIELQDKVDEINKLIRESIIHPDPDAELYPISDGIIDLERYL